MEDSFTSDLKQKGVYGDHGRFGCERICVITKIKLPGHKFYSAS